jgi:hypothetical protein
LAPTVGLGVLKVNPSSALSMVIRTEYRGQRYSMGSSDPLPAGFEIRFGVLNFQATGNGYLMRLTNRHGRCGSIGATAPPSLRPALASSAVRTPTCCAHHLAT